MNFCSCESPVRITLHGEDRLLPCGKCDVCRFNRSQALIERFALDSQHFKYCVLINLSYSNVFLPRLDYLDTYECFYVPNSIINDEDAGLSYDYKFLSDNDRKSFDEIKSLYGFIPRLRKYDLQRFLKRFRINIERKIRNKFNYEKTETEIKYLACGEYGPTTFRPHFHIGMLFNNEAIAKNFTLLLHSSWVYGHSSFRFASGKSASRYVAQYVNSLHCLPAFLKSKEVRPFTLVSKKNAFGCACLHKEEICKILTFRTPYLTIFDTEQGKELRVPLWRFLENKLFPRFTADFRLPTWLRVKLLGSAASCVRFQDFQDYVNNLCSGYYDDYYAYKYEIDYYKLMCKDSGGLSLGCIPKSMPIYNIWLASRRIVKNINLYGHETGINNIGDYVHAIDDYYINKEKLNQQIQFEFENSFYFKHSDWLKYVDSLSYDSSVNNIPVQKRYLERIHNVINHSHKNKQKTDYLNLHPEYRLDSCYEYFDEGFTPLY